MSASEKPPAADAPVADDRTTDTPPDSLKSILLSLAKVWQVEVVAAVTLLLLIAALVFVVISVIHFIEGVEADINHYEHLYSTLSLNRASIGDVGIFWGGYAAYAGTCLFLFAWLGRFPLTDSLQASFFAAVAAVVLVFMPLALFVLSIHAPVSVDGKHDVCGSWLYPAAKLPPLCAKEFRAASRWGLTVAAGGIILPIGGMAISILKKEIKEVVDATRQKKAQDEQEDRGEESRDEGSKDGREIRTEGEVVQPAPEAPGA